MCVFAEAMCQKGRLGVVVKEAIADEITAIEVISPSRMLFMNRFPSVALTTGAAQRQGVLCPARRASEQGGNLVLSLVGFRF